MATARTTAPRTTAPRFSGLTIPAAQSLNNAAARDRQIAAAADRALVPLTYGEDRIGALIANVLPAGANSTTLLIQCLWGYALDSINDVLLNDLALPAGSTVTHYTGSQSTADAALVAAFAAQGITYTSTLAGYAYSVVAMPTRAFDGQLNITARLRGRRLYDVRKDSTAGGTGAHRLADPATWEWSDCPALADADFLASTTYGIGVAVDWSTVAAAANANDALVGTPAEKRRTLGVSFTAAATALDVAETLRAYASCWHVPGASGIKLLADADGSPLATYAHASGQIAAIQPLVLQDLGNSPTAVEVIFTDASVTPWRESSAVASVSGAGSTLPWRLSLVRMPGVRRYSQAMREATERLNKLRLGNVSTQVDLFDDGIRHDVGDIIAITHPVGLSAQPMRVQQCTMTGLGRWRLDVTEHDAGAYSADVATRTAAALPSFVSPAGPPGAVAGFAVVASLDNGTLLGWADAPESDVNGWELRIGGANWAAATPLGGGSLPTIVGSTSYLWAQPAAGTYTLRIKALDSEGLQSSADTVITPTVAATKLAGIAAGANATSVDANGAIQGVSAGAGTVVSNAQVTINANGTLGGAGSGQASLTSLPGTVATAQIADAALTTAKFASGIEPVTVVAGSTVPTTKSTTAIVLTGTGKLYRWNGTAYVTSVATADLAGTITDAQIAGMAASKVTGQLSDTQLAAIGAAKVTGQIVGTQITDGAISTAKLSAGSVTAAVIAADTITAAQIAANAITSAELAAGAVVAGKIAAGSIQAADIAAGTITGDRIAANTITASQIAADTITAGQIAAGAVTASEIAAGAIRAQHILVAPKSLNLDPSFEGGAASWIGFVQRLPRSNASVPASCPAPFAAQFSNRDNPSFASIDVNPGEVYRASCWVNRGTGGGGAGLGVYGTVQGPDGSTVTSFAWPGAYTNATGWVRVTGLYTVPATGARLLFGPWADRTSYAGEAWYADLTVERAADASLIVDGAITAEKIQTGLLSADNVLTRGLTVRDNSGNVLLSAGQPLAATNITPAAGWLNSNVSLGSTGNLLGAGGGQIKTIPVLDEGQRETNQPPSWYSVGTTQEFKHAAAIGLSDADGYWLTLETIKQYAHSQGGYPGYQYAYQQLKTWRRRAVDDSGAAWTAWTQDLDRNAYTGDLDATYGATAGTNLKDSAGTVLADAAIKNDSAVIGGANLLGMSSFESWETSRPRGWGVYDNNSVGVTLTQSASAIGMFGTHYVRLTTPSAAVSTFGCYTNVSFAGEGGGVADWINSNTYVISYWVKAATAGMLGRYITPVFRNFGFASYETIEFPMLTYEWQRVTLRVVVGTTSTTNDNGELFISWDQAGGSLPAGAAYDLCAVKVERGRVPTTWVACERDNRNTRLVPSIADAATRATWSLVTSRPTELTDGRVATAISASGVLISRVAPGALAAPSASGLYLGSDYLGYYNAGTASWRTYMDNAGNFFLGGSGGALTWSSGVLNINGTLKVGSSPAVSGTTMTGTGGVINTGGTFALGNATTNISYNGSQLTLNGAIVTAANLNLTALSLSANTPSSSSFAKNDGITRTLGTVTVTASGGTTPYTYTWVLTNIEIDQGSGINDPDNAGNISATGNVCSYTARGDTDCAISVSAVCFVTDAKGFTASIGRTCSGTFGSGPP